MTYSKISVFVLLAVIAASLAACSIEPTIDDYDMYVMVHEIDEETQIPVAKIYKNHTLLFEGEHDKNITYSNFEVENGHLYFLKATYDEATRKYNRQMYKDFELFSTFKSQSIFAPPIIGFYNEHYLYCSHVQDPINGMYTYDDPEPISIRQFGLDDTEFCTLDNTQSLLNQHTVTTFFCDEKTKDLYFAGRAMISHSDISVGFGGYYDVFWKNKEEHVMPNNYYERPKDYFPATAQPEAIKVLNSEIIFGGWGYYWQGNNCVFLQQPAEQIKSIVSYNGNIYILSTLFVKEKDESPGNYGEYAYYQNAYIYKNGRLVYENNEVRNPYDLTIINGDCYYSAVEVSKYSNSFTIWKNNERYDEYGDVEKEITLLLGSSQNGDQKLRNHFVLVKK